MPTERVFAEALARAGIVAPLRFEERTPSTQAVAAEMAEAGAPEWTIVAARHQTAGRGRRGRSWRDRPGRSLLFSLVLRPVALPPSLAGVVSLLAGVAVAEAAGHVSSGDVACKWPNDVLLEGRKVAGILGEAAVEGRRLRHVVVGIGVNLEAPDGVDAAGLGDVDEVAFLESAVGRLRDGYAPESSSFAASTVARFVPLCATLGRDVEVETAGATVRGTAASIDPDGALVVLDEGRAVRVTLGDVEHVG
jgi:BirA family biotin operon repressor/biotin-[acetyl-CoA-carboxylase] ligase